MRLHGAVGTDRALLELERVRTDADSAESPAFFLLYGRDHNRGIVNISTYEELRFG